MTHDQLQFAISQYLDGTLPADQALALRQRLEVDAEARRVLEEYTALNVAMKASPLPEVRWDALAQRIGQAAHQQADARLGPEPLNGQGLSNEQEYTITRYVDGELSADEGRQVEQLLTASPAARKLAAEHRSLDTVLKHAWPLPDVRWDRLQAHLSEAIAEEAQASRFRIGNWLGHTTRIAAAACLFVAVGLAVLLVANREGANPGTPTRVAVVEVAGPEQASGAPTVQISFGPSEEYARSSLDPYSSPLVTVPSRVQIASSYRPAVNGGWLPY